MCLRHLNKHKLAGQFGSKFKPTLAIDSDIAQDVAHFKNSNFATLLRLRSKSLIQKEILRNVFFQSVFKSCFPHGNELPT